MSEDKTCPNCGVALMPGDIFCGDCGVRVRAPAYDAISDVPFDDVAPSVLEEPSDKEAVSAARSAAAEYVAPPPDRQKSSEWPALRIVAIVVAVVFLLTALCLCGFGGFALIPSGDTTFEEDLGFATILCFVPGVLSALLGTGAAYFGFRKR